ncbi:hypothetical protein DFQ26_004821 [Actinomortierella ambigua]|nr:hypothetical protein DFQ26_004821 [Actinomortierella ambigua]
MGWIVKCPWEELHQVTDAIDVKHDDDLIVTPVLPVAHKFMDHQNQHNEQATTKKLTASSSSFSSGVDAAPALKSNNSSAHDNDGESPDSDRPPAFSTTNTQCRCRSNQPCWPSATAWASLNTTVGGRLIATHPGSQPCHDPFYDRKACEAAHQHYRNATWRGDQPGVYMFPMWEKYRGQGCTLGNGHDHGKDGNGTHIAGVGVGCDLRPQQPCERGSVPLYTVRVATIEDVQASIRFSTQYNVQIAVKNTGHDFMGRHNGGEGAGGDVLSVWTRFLNRIQVVDHFVPEGTSNPSGSATGQPAVIIGAGVIGDDLYRVVGEHGRVVVAGADATVGMAGGYCMGGGHGPLTRSHGLCADNVLQYTVVTADGQVRRANAVQNQDLFWALRGGGGGTFGIVVEAVLRTFPALPAVASAKIVITSWDRSAIQGALSRIAAQDYERWWDEGWSGYVFATTFRVEMVLLHGNRTSQSASRESFAHFAQQVRALSCLVTVTEQYYQYPSFYDSFNHFKVMPTIVGMNVITATRLIPRDFFDSSSRPHASTASPQTPPPMSGADTLAAALHQIQDDVHPFNPIGFVAMSMVGGKGVAEADASAVSVSPAWRSTQLMVTTIVEWPETAKYAVQQNAMQTLSKAMDRLRHLTPGSGAYFNEADLLEPDWQTSFFGNNYPRLRQVKNKYDPKGFFVCRKCVGSEDWDEGLMCRTHVQV